MAARYSASSMDENPSLALEKLMRMFYTDTLGPAMGSKPLRGILKRNIFSDSITYPVAGNAQEMQIIHFPRSRDYNISILQSIKALYAFPVPQALYLIYSPLFPAEDMSQSYASSSFIVSKLGLNGSGTTGTYVSLGGRMNATMNLKNVLSYHFLDFKTIPKYASTPDVYLEESIENGIQTINVPLGTSGDMKAIQGPLVQQRRSGDSLYSNVSSAFFTDVNDMPTSTGVGASSFIVPGTAVTTDGQIIAMVSVPSLNSQPGVFGPNLPENGLGWTRVQGSFGLTQTAVAPGMNDTLLLQVNLGGFIAEQLIPGVFTPLFWSHSANYRMSGSYNGVSQIENTCDFDFEVFCGYFVDVVFVAAFVTGSASPLKTFVNGYITVEFSNNMEHGDYKPMNVFCLTNLNAGQEIGIFGYIDYLGEPSGLLLQQVPQVSNYSDPNSQAALSYANHAMATGTLREIMSVKAYDALNNEYFTRIMQEYGGATFEASPWRMLGKLVKPIARDLGKKAIKKGAQYIERNYLSMGRQHNLAITQGESDDRFNCTPHARSEASSSHSQRKDDDGPEYYECSGRQQSEGASAPDAPSRVSVQSEPKAEGVDSPQNPNTHLRLPNGLKEKVVGGDQIVMGAETAKFMEKFMNPRRRVVVWEDASMKYYRLDKQDDGSALLVRVIYTPKEVAARPTDKAYNCSGRPKKMSNEVVPSSSVRDDQGGRGAKVNIITPLFVQPNQNVKQPVQFGDYLKIASTHGGTAKFARSKTATSMKAATLERRAHPGDQNITASNIYNANNNSPTSVAGAGPGPFGLTDLMEQVRIGEGETLDRQQRLVLEEGEARVSRDKTKARLDSVKPKTIISPTEQDARDQLFSGKSAQLRVIEDGESDEFFHASSAGFEARLGSVMSSLTSAGVVSDVEYHCSPCTYDRKCTHYSCTGRVVIVESTGPTDVTLRFRCQKCFKQTFGNFCAQCHQVSDPKQVLSFNCSGRPKQDRTPQYKAFMDRVEEIGVGEAVWDDEAEKLYEAAVGSLPAESTLGRFLESQREMHKPRKQEVVEGLPFRLSNRMITVKGGDSFPDNDVASLVLSWMRGPAINAAFKSGVNKMMLSSTSKVAGAYAATKFGEEGAIILLIATHSNPIMRLGGTDCKYVQVKGTRATAETIKIFRDSVMITAEYDETLSNVMWNVPHSVNEIFITARPLDPKFPVLPLKGDSLGMALHALGINVPPGPPMTGTAETRGGITSFHAVADVKFKISAVKAQNLLISGFVPTDDEIAYTLANYPPSVNASQILTIASMQAAIAKKKVVLVQSLAELLGVYNALASEVQDIDAAKIKLSIEGYEKEDNANRARLENAKLHGVATAVASTVTFDELNAMLKPAMHAVTALWLRVEPAGKGKKGSVLVRGSAPKPRVTALMEMEERVEEELMNRDSPSTSLINQVGQISGAAEEATWTNNRRALYTARNAGIFPTYDEKGANIPGAVEEAEEMAAAEPKTAATKATAATKGRSQLKARLAALTEVV